jgi:protein arginine N-methyltransferase 7
VTSPSASALESGLACHRRGAFEEAERYYLEVLRQEPEHERALKLLAVLAFDRRDLEGCERTLSLALRQRPDDADLLHLRGSLSVTRGDFHAAREALTKALERRPSDPVGLLCEFAVCEAKLSNPKESLARAAQALKLEPANTVAARAAAQALYQLGRFGEAVACLDRVLAREPRDAASLHLSALALSRLGQQALAYERSARALELEPDNPKYAFRRRALASSVVPDWHFNMMNDEPRNRSFAAAIAAQVRPDLLVLEIGTGSGLLAMLAAGDGDGAPGARRVITCEGNTAIAEAARRIIDENGLAGRVSVVAKPSTELVVGVDLPEPADLLIAEIFSVQVTTEGVLPSLEDAKRRLLKPQASVIPARAVARGALVGGDALSRMVRVGRVCGFDLSAFNRFTPVQQHLTPGQKIEFLSEPVDLLRFDFIAESEWPASRVKVTLTASRRGVCQGVAQWLKLELDDEHVCEHAPGDEGTIAARHWAPVWYPLETPVEVEAGETLSFMVTNNRAGVRVELDGRR